MPSPVKEAANVEVALAASLWRSFCSRWMVGHGLETDAARANKAIHHKGGASHQPANGAQNAATAL
jgi:hypothetical protein